MDENSLKMAVEAIRVFLGAHIFLDIQYMSASPALLLLHLYYHSILSFIALTHQASQRRKTLKRMFLHSPATHM